MNIEIPTTVVTVLPAPSRSPAPQLPSGQHSRSGGKNIFNTHHDQQQGKRHTHGGQRDIRIQHADVSRVHNIVYRLG